MPSRTLPAAIIPTGTAAYAANNLVGGKITFGNAERRPSVGGRIRTIVVGDQEGKNAPGTLWLFDADPTASTFTDKAVLNVASADVSKIIAAVPIGSTDYVAIGTFVKSIATEKGLEIPYNGALYGAFQVAGSFSWAGSTSLSVRVGVEADGR
jgi:hypothetical protein